MSSGDGQDCVFPSGARREPPKQPREIAHDHQEHSRSSEVPSIPAAMLRTEISYSNHK